MNPAIAAVTDGSPSSRHPLDSSIRVHKIALGKKARS